MHLAPSLTVLQEAVKDHFILIDCILINCILIDYILIDFMIGNPNWNF